ncbi:hypothetical protein JTE90_008897 [Oedothorax gibbosus]|uniref:Myosin light chain kinase, smooth muscle n=1 Tax=Oedothorax gibbosus TaxID=931172 RepID=A0AAV6ULL1_9ARAC|nr:hypothetical protein JTE90_008897 [Oedothorax gibbosus]
MISLRACAPRFVSPLSWSDAGCFRTVECRVEGYPRPDIRWDRYGRPVANSRRVHVTRTGDRCVLQIRMPCSEEDCGTYTCVATNNIGSVRTKVTLSGSNSITMNGSSHSSPQSPPKEWQSRSRSVERSPVSTSECKTLSSLPRNRSESSSHLQSKVSVPKSKVATFTSHICINNIECEGSEYALKQTKEATMDPNTKKLSQSMDDCRKNRRGFLNRVKIPDIFASSKNSKATESPAKSKSSKVHSSTVSAKLYQSTASLKDSIKTQQNYETKINLPITKNSSTKLSCQRSGNGTCVNINAKPLKSVKRKDVLNGSKPNCAINAIEQSETDEPEVQLTTRERIAAYLKRFESSTNSVRPKDSKCNRLPRRTAESFKSAVPKHEKKKSRDETLFGKFRRRISSVDDSKKIAHLFEKEEKVTALKTNGISTEKHNESNVQSRFRWRTSNVEDRKGIPKNAKKEIDSIEQPSNGISKTDSIESKLPPKENENRDNVFSKFEDKHIGPNKNACVESVASKDNRQGSLKCDTNYVNSSRDVDVLRNSRESILDDEGNGIMQLKDIYGFVNTTSDKEDLLELNAENDVKTKNSISYLDDDQSFLKCTNYVDDLGSFKSIDVNLMDEFNDFSSEFHSSEEPNAETENIEVDRISDQVLLPDENVPELKENLIPSIHIEQSPEENSFNELEEDTIQRIINDAPKELVDEPSSTNHTSYQKPCRGKIKYSAPLLEEECVELVSGNSRPATPEPDPQRALLLSPARIIRGPQSVTVLRGESLTLAAGFDGRPTPKVVWMKGGRVLREEVGGRLSILEGAEMSAVTVSDVTADDSGKYVVSVENEGGGDSCFASVAVVGFPEPPGSEPTASEVTDHSLVASWYGSMYDGGSVVTGYQVEMCTLPDKKWHKVASSVNTSCTVLGLSKGQKYVFRVRAENRYGLSHPSKESKVIRLDDFLQESSSDEEVDGEEYPTPIAIESGVSFTERFDLKEEVGKGRFGVVYRCVENSSGRARAAKVIRCVKAKDRQKVHQEIDIMGRLHHPKLMHVLAAFESGRNMIVVMEYISGGELFERVIADDFVLTERDCVLFMRQICSGVAHMHAHNVIHFDLKPENILCKTRSSHKIKIIDFGLARVYDGDESLRVLFGTPEFVAPEIINYEPVGPGSDMWSVGVICYVLLSGLSPFMGDSDPETFSNITRGEMDFDDEAFDEISQEAKLFISQLLVKQVKKRLSAEECLKHPWLATGGAEQKRPLSTEKLKRFIIRRKWQKSGTAIRALGRMVSLSRSSLGSSCDSPLHSPTSSRSRSSLVSRSETADSNESDVFQER